MNPSPLKNQVREPAVFEAARRSLRGYYLKNIVATLITLAWEVKRFGADAATFASGVVRFSLVLFGIFFIYSGILNRLVSRSIVRPLEDLLGVVKKVRQRDFKAQVQVVSNDEIGILGDATNTMIRGLAEREAIRSAFGRYVSPEIRDEILSGRIPLEGELYSDSGLHPRL